MALKKEGYRKAYELFLNQRCKLLSLKTVASKRLACMMRIFSPSEGVALQKALDLLTESKELNYLLAVENDLYPYIPTPTYMPAMLVNLVENSPCSNREEMIKEATLKGVPILIKGLKIQRQMVENGDWDLNKPISFLKLSGIAKTNPEKFTEKCSLKLSKEGYLEF